MAVLLLLTALPMPVVASVCAGGMLLRLSGTAQVRPAAERHDGYHYDDGKDEVQLLL